MKNNFIKKTLLLFALSLAIISCDKDDQVGDSQLTPANPTATITFDFGNPTIVVEGDQEYTFSVTISSTNIVDTILYVEQVGGDADTDDYEVTGQIRIPAGYTTGTGTIKILEDDLIEDTEHLVLQVGDLRTANTSMTPATAQFTILNATAADLVIDMSWSFAVPVYDTDSGDEIGATTLADMILSVYDSSDMLVAQADGGSFETIVFEGIEADGDYTIEASFFSAEDYERLLSLNVEFNQQGTINHLSYDFADALDIQQTCADNFFVLASFTKMGSNYDIMPVGEDNALNPEGDWTLQMDDSWGDGWDGAQLIVDIEGTETSYTCVGSQTIVVVTVPEGTVDFSVTYVAGNFEEEHSYVITAPDGSTTADGPNPAEGVVVSSGSICP